MCIYYLVVGDAVVNALSSEMLSRDAVNSFNGSIALITKPALLRATSDQEWTVELHSSSYRSGWIDPSQKPTSCSIVRQLQILGIT